MRFIIIWLAFLPAFPEVLPAQDTILSHWPTVRETPVDPAKRDALLAAAEKLLEMPARQSVRKATPPVRDSSAEWKQLQTARQLTDARDFMVASQLAGRVLEAARQKKDRRLEMCALAQIGDISREVFLGASLKAVPYHEQALGLATALKDTLFMVRELMALADNYGQAGRNEPFLDFASRAAGLLERYDSPANLMGLFNMCGCFLSGHGDVPGAEKMFRASLSIARQLGNEGYTQHLYWQLFSLYLGAGNAAQAQTALDSACVIGPRIPDAEWHHYHYQLEKLLGNREQAFAHLEQAYRQMGDEYTRRGAEQLAGWETRLRMREKEIQLEEQQRHRRLLYGLALMLAALCALAFYAYLRQRENHQKIRLQATQIEQQAVELRSLDNAKSNFFANVSHELRTPLTLIQGPLEQAVQDESLAPRTRRFIEMARDNGRQLLELINQLLELTRFNTAPAPLREEPVALYAFIGRIAGEFQSLALSREIDLSADTPAGPDYQALTDRDKLQKILNNLLGNALKFTPPGGSVRVSMAVQNDFLQLRVTDTGAGIQPDDLPHIFDRYFQSKRREARVEGGFGIGLAYSRELAEIAGGSLAAESAPGQGSTFLLKWPAKPAPMSAETPVTPVEQPIPNRIAMTGPDAAARGMARLLIVEDNYDMQEYLRELLAGHFGLTMRANGHAALEYLRAAPELPDLIVSDVMMPVMDGFDLLEALRSKPSLRAIPVILLTARTGAADRQRAFRTGIDDYVVKPFDAEELLARINNALRNQETRREWATLTGDPENAQTEKSSLPADPWVLRLETAVQENLGDYQLNVDFLAGLMQMSRKTLYARIRESTGLSANQFIQEIRLLQARKMLESGQVRSLRELSDTLGIRSADYLSRLYRERFGKSPTAYL